MVYLEHGVVQEHVEDWRQDPFFVVEVRLDEHRHELLGQAFDFAARNVPEQGGFARPVVAEQPVLFAAVQEQVGVVQQHLRGGA